MGKRSLFTDLLLIFVSFIWGVNFTIGKSALAEFSPLSFITLRYGIAAFLLTLTLIVTREKWKIQREDWGKLIFLAFVGNTINALLFISGLAYSSASIAALLATAAPPFVALLNLLYGMESLNRFLWLGIGLSFVGIFGITGENAGWQFDWDQQGFKGNLLLIGTTITWSIYTAFGKPLLRKYSPLQITTHTTGIGFILLIPFVFPALLHQNWDRISIESWMAVFYAGVFAAAIAHVIWYYAVKHIGSTRTVIYSNLTPLVGVLTAWLYLGEQLTPLEILGACMILAGIYLTKL